MLASDDIWPYVVSNLQRYQHTLEQLTMVLVRKGSGAWTSGRIYVAVVQEFFLYGSETGATKPIIGRYLVSIPMQGGPKDDETATMKGD